MIQLIQYLVIVLYLSALGFILLFSLQQVRLSYTYRKSKKFKKTVRINEKDHPKVTIQLPVFNEKYVIERLIKAVFELDYPADKLEIQILDDSTDETTDIITGLLRRPMGRKLDVKHIHRTVRTGFKAGALAEGLIMARGDLIAIFDADFIPSIDFLKKTTPYFEDRSVGMVQTRWGHLNKEYSMLTRLQAFGLDAHFSVEQSGRSQSGFFINFNGTAGVWRKEAITDAGGWESDTLTEDLDLSYRAQLRGWKFRFIEEIESPAELPAEIGSLRSQQFRWSKGASQNAKKIIPEVLRSNIPLITKIHAFFHLNNSAVFVCIIIILLLSIPMIILKPDLQYNKVIFSFTSLSLSGFLLLGYFYYPSYIEFNRHSRFKVIKFLFYFPLFLTVSMGLAFHNAIGVIEGWMGIRSSFIRTPKYNLSGRKGTWLNKGYYRPALSPVNIGELAVILYSVSGIIIGIQLNDMGLVPFHLMMAAGTAIILGYSMIQPMIRK
jgi:cellulose synthase/poly-beta-1,6-N-acetylglucosamine synthase-like glycosyltransferase